MTIARTYSKNFHSNITYIKSNSMYMYVNYFSINMYIYFFSNNMYIITVTITMVTITTTTQHYHNNIYDTVTVSPITVTNLKVITLQH